MKSIAAILSLVVIVFFGVQVTHAQVEKGDNLIGFSSSVSTQSSNPSSINVTVLVSYERYLSRKLALGIGPFASIITARGSMLGIFGGNLFANYGFITGDGKFYPYVGILGSISQSISTTDTKYQFSEKSNADKKVAPSGNYTVSFFGAGAKVGTKIFITERINLDFNVNYSTNLSSRVNGELIGYGDGDVIMIFAGIGVIIGKRAGE